MADTNLLVLNCSNPECNKAFRVKCPDKNGTFKVICPVCKQVKYIRLGEPVPVVEQSSTSTVVPAPQQQSAPTTQVFNHSEAIMLDKGQLIRIKRFWRNATYPLREGSNLIGRADDKLPSHISIDDDPTISRQSVEISVNKTKFGGYSISFSVLNASNPITYSIYNAVTKQYSDRILQIGDTLSMHYGDRIKLGKSLFEYQKS